MLSKGVPSTFANVKALYDDESKRKTIEELVNSFVGEKATMNGSADTHANGETPDKFQQSVLYFLAQHYNYHKSRDLKKAMEFVDRALEADPKSVDCTMTKARILKHMGEPAKAAETMNAARELDTRDRYINTKCAKYQLRNNENDKALETMSKFTRNETAGGPLGDLHDMQCMWFITEDGLAWLRQDNLGLALKRFKSIYDIFDIWQEDQFDFHSFSLRKGQIRAYVDMVRWEDHLRDHPFYTRAAISAINIYVRLHDNPDLAQSNTNGANLEGLDASERKKALKKAKKEQEKKEKEEAEKREAANKGKKAGADGEVKKEDTDPKGVQLLQTKTPLEEATKYLVPLLEYSPKVIAAQHVGFEVYLRKGTFRYNVVILNHNADDDPAKYLLALRSLLAAAAIDPKDKTLQEQIPRFRKALENLKEPLPPKVKEVVDSQLKSLP